MGKPILHNYTDSTDMWKDILLDRSITYEKDLVILKLIYESKNHELRASEIAHYMGLSHHGPVNLQISRFSTGYSENKGSTTIA